MSYNIADNLDPEFLEYLKNLPVEFLQEMYLAWLTYRHVKNSPVVILDIDHNRIYSKPKKRKPLQAIKASDIYKLDKLLHGKGFDFIGTMRKLNEQ